MGESLLNVRIINNLYGVRYQTQGMVRCGSMEKPGWVSQLRLQLPNGNFGSTKFSVGYGGGAQVWMHRNFGITLDVFITMSLLICFPVPISSPVGRVGFRSDLHGWGVGAILEQARGVVA